MSTTQDAPSSSPPAYERQPQAGTSSLLTVPQLTDVQRLSMEDEERPLPEGWLRQFDPVQKHHFYVDTKADPPRSIWIHPYEDPEWMKANANKSAPTSPVSYPPPPGPPDAPTSPKAGPSAEKSPDSKRPDTTAAAGDTKKSDDTKKPQPSTTSTKGKEKEKEKERGFFGKLKDKAIGTKEAREHDKALRKQEAELIKQAREDENTARYIARRQAISQAHWARAGAYHSGYSRPMYSAPVAPYGRQRRGGMGGSALPLAGGLAGGFLLGSALGSFGDDYGGGDFGGGDFGGDF